MEVLVLVDFEGTMGDEMTMHTGDIVKDVTKAGEEGWLEGELRGRRGIFPANFVKEVPVYLIGDSKREPRSIRKSRVMKQKRRCEVTFNYKPSHEDELELVAGETVEILREIEDGWWMGLKDGKVGAFPSNFVKEILITPKEAKHSEGKARPKLADAVFTKETKQPQRASVRNKNSPVTECCQVMFDYTACTEDELELKRGDIVTIIRKETEDEGWWEGELNGRRGCFPDNFVMVIPPASTQPGTVNRPPVRQGSVKRSVKAEASAMDKGSPAKPNDEKPEVKDQKPEVKDQKPEVKDLRSNPPTKVKLPSFHKPSPPPVKDKPPKVLPRASEDAVVVTPKRPEEKDSDQFDGVDASTEKLNHITANRAKPPNRRPPSGLVISQPAPTSSDQTEAEPSPKKSPAEKSPKSTDSSAPASSESQHPPETPPPAQPVPAKVGPDAKTENQQEQASLENLHAEIKELKMALELLKTQQAHDIQEVKEELRAERSKVTALQDEVLALRMSH